MIPSAVIVAGGSGKRMGASQPKQFLPLNGKPILIHTLERFLNWHPQMEVALVLPNAHMETYQRLADKHLLKGLRDRIHLCEGGSSRTASVWSGLSFLQKHVEKPGNYLVGIHDGVRPFVPEEVLKNAYELAAKEGASVVCVAVKASLRKRQGERNSVPVDRSEYVEVQTPQVFRLEKICHAFEVRPHDLFTDDASLYQSQGNAVAISEGSYDNIKITTPEDLAVGAEILRRQKNGVGE